MAGLYIHIPFCASRCIYCAFYSTTNIADQDEYARAICKEIDLRKTYLSEKEDYGSIDTIYLGGGTPSLLSGDNLYLIFNHIYKKYKVSSNAEVTIECNPDDITDDFVKRTSNLPINRVSIGVQSFSDKRLRFLQRRHTSKNVYDSINKVRNMGVNNISIDLIFGFPTQTLMEWKDDLRKALALRIQHISAYSLMYEEGTKLYNLKDRNKVLEIDDDLSYEMFNTLIDILTANGYSQYEISNFALEGYESKHNSSYWSATDYIGIGASAHSYNGKSRQWNISSIKKYISNINNGIIPMEIEYINEEMRYNDLITTTLRTKKGLNLGLINDKQKTYLLNNAKEQIRKGNLSIDDNYISLTRQGLFISDDVMSDLILV